MLDARAEFYQCQFRKIVSQYYDFAGGSTNVAPSPDNIEFLSVAIAAFQELGNESMLLQMLGAVKAADLSDDHSAYLAARHAHYAGDVDQALIEYRQLMSRSGRANFLGTLGLANVLINDDTRVDYDLIVKKLRSFRDLRADDQISRSLFLANHHIEVDPEIRVAEGHLFDALSLATTKCWSYFQQKAIYGLCKASLLIGNVSQLKAYFAVLKNMTPPEHVYLQRLIARHLQPALAAAPLILSPNTHSLHWMGKTISLIDRPLIFRLIHALATSGNLDRDELCRNLWHQERFEIDKMYPRLFNLINRTRKLLDHEFRISRSIVCCDSRYRMVVPTKEDQDELVESRDVSIDAARASRIPSAGL